MCRVELLTEALQWEVLDLSHTANSVCMCVCVCVCVHVCMYIVYVIYMSLFPPVLKEFNFYYFENLG